MGLARRNQLSGPGRRANTDQNLTNPTCLEVSEMATEHCFTTARPSDVIPASFLSLIFDNGIPTSLPVDTKGNATRADVMTEIQRLWERAMNDCQPERRTR